MLGALIPPSGEAASAAGSQLEFGVDMAKRGLWNEALFRFRQAERERPGDPQVLNNIAVAYEALGLFEEALEAYRKALDVSPSNRDLRANYSRFHEFYQSFRPVEPEAGGEAGEETEVEPEESEEAADG
jgi:tetratricopeptide (TPR) repeat protein